MEKTQEESIAIAQQRAKDGIKLVIAIPSAQR